MPWRSPHAFYNGMILLDRQDFLYSDIISVRGNPSKPGAVKARLQFDGSACAILGYLARAGWQRHVGWDGSAFPRKGALVWG